MFRYRSQYCVSLIGENHHHDYDSCMDWFCPINTFEYQGSCVAVCPLPYYHQIDSNGVGRCVINCPSRYTKDTFSRICACGTLPSSLCPSNLKSTPFGCLCPRGTFFNSYNQQLSLNSTVCFTTCGPFLYAHKDGLCVPCPKYC